MQTAQASHSPSSSACIHDTGCDAYIYSHRLRQNSVVSAHSIASNCTVSSERDVKSRAPVSHPRLTSQRAPILVCTMANPMTNICANFDQVGQAFAQHYYNTFDADRSQLGPLYNDTYSMLNFEHSNERPGQYKGSAAIVEKLKSLPFQQVKHRVVTLDTQPSPNGGVVVVVCGDLLIDGEQHAQKFSQTFQLMPTEAAGLAPGSYFIFNDIFRLNVG